VVSNALREGADAMLELAALRTECDALRKTLRAAKDALRSYQYGNSATELAEEVANHCDAALQGQSNA
jgi:hypothetical protein